MNNLSKREIKKSMSKLEYDVFRRNEELDNYCIQLEARVDKLNKVLDKACQELVNLKEAAECYDYVSCPWRDPTKATCSGNCYKKECWKEWLLKNEKDGINN